MTDDLSMGFGPRGSSAELLAVLRVNLPEDQRRRAEIVRPVEPPETDEPRREAEFRRTDPIIPLPEPLPVWPGTPAPPRFPTPPKDPGIISDPDRAAGFEAVEREAKELREAVEKLVEDDMRLARNEIEQQGRDNPGIVGAISAQFSESGALLRQAIDSALDALDAYIDNVLRPHADVPRQLEEEGEGLRTAGASTEEIAREMGELLEAESWEGEAADAYKAAATVQHKATQELAGVMLSGGAALQRSADLNLATFFVVAERTRMARRTVDVMARLNRGGPQPYARTQLAAGQLRRLLSRLQDAVASIAEGEAASELAGELDALADLPNLLAPLKWPTGTDLADQTPAETGSAITRE